MSRPAAPSYLVEPFAPDTNYAAGGETWNSNATKVAPPGAASVGFEPNTGVAAQCLNYLHNRRYVEGAAAKAKMVEVFDYLGQGPALNFRVGAATVANHAAYNFATRSWMFAKATKTVEESVTAGQTTTGTNVLSALGGAANCLRVACAADGSAVVTTSTRDVYERSAAGTWTYRANSIPIAPEASNAYEIAYNPVTSKWLAFHAGVSSMVFASSPDRFTWTTQTLTSFAVSGNSLGRMAVDETTGRVVIVNQPLPASTGNAEFATSLSDGSDWPPTLSVVNHGFTTNVRMSLTWNKSSGLFVFTVGSTSGGSKVYTSSDGTAWTLVCTLTTAAIVKVATLGELWLAAVWSNELAFSVDRGATWKRADFALGTDVLSGTPQCLVANGGQFLALTNANVWPSQRVGAGFSSLT